MSYAWSDMSYQEKKAAGSGAIVFVFSLFFVFLILAAQYESWSLPWSILLGTPFAIFGAMRHSSGDAARETSATKTTFLPRSPWSC